ncbi:MAG: hypothetical protein Kow00128_01560 [Deltaproteobacteria bacterium]
MPQRRRYRAALCLAALLLLPACHPRGEGKSVTGTLVRLDREGRTLTVEDGMGGRWNFRVDRDAGIDLSSFSEGSKVRVTIARGTPPNMVSAADRIRKGDRIEPVEPPGRP